MSDTILKDPRKAKALWLSGENLPGSDQDSSLLSDNDTKRWEELSFTANAGNPGPASIATSQLIAKGWHDPKGSTAMSNGVLAGNIFDKCAHNVDPTVKKALDFASGEPVSKLPKEFRRPTKHSDRPKAFANG